MTFRVAALYQFVALPDAGGLLAPLREICADSGLKGTIILAHEGINGTVAGTAEAIEGFIDALREGPLFDGRLDRLELKFSAAAAMPFKRLKVHLKPEIVTFGDIGTDPARRTGTYVDATGWNRLIGCPDTLVIDTRNQFEVAMGTFDGAVDPRIGRFSGFRDFVARELDPAKHRKVAMFCTGGIRCEKASSYLLSRGFQEVYHLRGGILKYLEEIAPAESRWTGECFVFDERVALGHGLAERGPGAALEGAQTSDD
ncbi:rhodanese-related sulfurtransferase [Phreatobacter stygius]|uniref:tRNA uridine(34) hydroxylase n=1 Tax=Phreatobacter stygius TaxID=1940610 RepID=A0A4D7AZC3_9HYPH|nr:rhodanese-related sulfurtransferase [Phreatobacter stygius]QCI66699.1 rhodanese-related sulfurtransferase [Phreatobacter stygius]